MRNWRNRVFTNLKNYINDKDIDFVVDNNHKLVKNKTIYFQLLSNTELANDLENTEENAQNLMIQIECYTRSLDDGYNLADKVVDAMKYMGFSKIYGAELMVNIDTNYKRLVMRFARVIGSGNEIKQI